MGKTKYNLILDMDPPLPPICCAAHADEWGRSGQGDFRGDLSYRETRHIMRWIIDVFHHDIHLSFIIRWFVIFVFKRPKRSNH